MNPTILRSSEFQSIQHKLNSIPILDFIKIVFKGNKAKQNFFFRNQKTNKQNPESG